MNFDILRKTTEEEKKKIKDAIERARKRQSKGIRRLDNDLQKT